MEQKGVEIEKYCELRIDSYECCLEGFGYLLIENSILIVFGGFYDLFDSLTRESGRDSDGDLVCESENYSDMIYIIRNIRFKLTYYKKVIKFTYLKKIDILF